MPYDYEIRFTDQGSTALPTNIQVPFEIWRIEKDASYKAKNLFFQDNATDTPENKNKLTNGDVVKVLEDYFDFATNATKTGFTFQFQVNIPDQAIAPKSGDVFKMVLTKPYFITDKFTFKTEAQKINPQKDQLSNIKVVPNPYIVRNAWERSSDYARLMFINMPEQYVIRIFTLAGDHVRTIDSEKVAEEGIQTGPGWVFWDLLTHNDQKIAPGVYIFHVNVPDIGDHIGKFAIVR
jgi:hypothetical protein